MENFRAFITYFAHHQFSWGVLLGLAVGGSVGLTTALICFLDRLKISKEIRRLRQQRPSIPEIERNFSSREAGQQAGEQTGQEVAQPDAAFFNRAIKPFLIEKSKDDARKAHHR